MSDKQMPVTTRRDEAGTLIIDIPPAAAVPGAWINRGNGWIVVLKEVDGTNITSEYAIHPVILLVTELLSSVREEATDKGAQAILQALLWLGTNAPFITADQISAMMTEAMPWPTELAHAQLRAGRVEGFNGSQAPQINVSIQTPQINLPPSEPPIVNTVIKNELPAAETVVEEIDIERDANGFMTGATKTRRRGKQAAA